MSDDQNRNCANERTIEGRRRVVALLDELRSAGFVRYKLTPPEIEGPEPHLDVLAERDDLNRSAWGMGVSAEAARMWDLLRGGVFQIAPSLQAILNVLEAGARR
jgi:hypothetical protein